MSHCGYMLFKLIVDLVHMNSKDLFQSFKVVGFLFPTTCFRRELSILERRYGVI